MNRLAGWAAAAIVLHAATSHAQNETDLEEAQGLYQEANFTGAKEAFEKALGGALAEGTRSLAHAHLAAIAIIFDDVQEAESHALRAVAHDPAVEVPEGAPRALDAMLGEARERLAALRLTLELRSREGGRALLELMLDPPSDELVTELALGCEMTAGPSLDERGPPPRLALEVAREPMRCTGRATGTGGVALLEVERSLFADELSPATPAPTTAPDEQTRNRRLALALGGTGLVVVGAIVAGALAARSTPDQVSFGETRVEGWP